jgi:hypothetical protein
MTQPTPQQRPAATWTITDQPNRYAPLWSTGGTGGPSGTELGPRLMASLVCRKCGRKVKGMKCERKKCK